VTKQTTPLFPNLPTHFISTFTVTSLVELKEAVEFDIANPGLLMNSFSEDVFY